MVISKTTYTLTGKLISLRIIYAFRMMQCEDFYSASASQVNTMDRCNRNEIDAGTATQVSLLGLLTASSGIINLFVAGWQIQHWGAKLALILQTGLPAVRVAIQVVGIALGGRIGIIIVQASQFIGIFGGSAGYLLVLNTSIGQIAEPEKRTGAFGELQGCVMFGTAIGYLVGGQLGDAYGIRRPFEASCVLFILACLYAAIVTPHIDQTASTEVPVAGKSGLQDLLGPLAMLAPIKCRSGNGKVTKHYGILFLGLGVFLGVLATGYAPILIQMYATNAFNFHSTENGYLMACNSLIRGVYLLFLFPQIIAHGRKWLGSPKPTPESYSPDDSNEDQVGATDEDGTTKMKFTLSGEGDGRAFDLVYLRWSLVADGLVTAYTAFATKDWQIYLVGFLLPLASGSAPASKGVVTEMCRPADRAKALQMMTLLENVALLSTLGLFGFVFSAFSAIGKSYLTFYCNAGVAIVAALVLCFSHVKPTEEEHNEGHESDYHGTIENA